LRPLDSQNKGTPSEKGETVLLLNQVWIGGEWRGVAGAVATPAPSVEPSLFGTTRLSFTIPHARLGTIKREGMPVLLSPDDVNGSGWFRKKWDML
jgi:hypothetical protein